MTEEEHDAKLAAETQALREEVARAEQHRNDQADLIVSLRTEVAALRMARDDLKLERDLARQNFCDEQAANYQLQAHLKACLGELSELRARVVVVQDWQPLTAVGQVEIGDLLRFTVGGKEIEAPTVLVIAPGDPKEEIIYNRGKNHYFITSMAVDGTSSHKNVMVKRPSGKTVSEDLLRRIERECRRESDWNCENVPAGTKAATTRAKKMLEIANDLRDLLGEQEGGRQ
ncbi:hypothetical protein ACNAQ8_18645 [Pseudomonas aeruginosa]|uniref:hypothetical protein n=1 Tax=Pseudomonas aeruginosa TaxID=287 RepID=UPI0021E71A14|nr:hypothetical protein [Pseudomonas aeruginosa]MBX5744460.1 hypothetical protein [Pseudomonas aeruginosa]MBX6055029.1 hypothetical protein [Pseudomonas aeruginosa]MBX6080337.1 hypothetical protein [Pseudomonas aeruginosa]MBX6256135.1 hypothetical protein [Pseudomonas aeruginosa]MCV3881436.1 hypothetical protein [Pseudomonas aeruginosa]